MIVVKYRGFGYLVAIGMVLSALVVGCNEYNSKEHNPKAYIVPINYDEIISNPSSFSTLSNDELISFFCLTKRLPDQYLFLHENYVIQFSVDSASSIEEANENSKERVSDGGRYETSKNIPTSSEVVFEGDAYYITHVNWVHSSSGSYSADAICFKSEYVDFIPRVPTKGKQFSMDIKDVSKAQEIIDLYEYSTTARISHNKLVVSNIEEKDDKYVYQNYVFSSCHGDFNMKDTISLHSNTYDIDKISGKVTRLQEELINTAEGFNILTLDPC